MYDLDKLAKLRFGMTEVPKIGGQPGIYEEKWSQWFLERSFFRDFVYRNPAGKKKGQELADAVVLFDDVMLMVQVKAQCGKHNPISWAKEKLVEAFKQLCKTHKSLVGGEIKKLKNDFYGEIAFDPKSYPNRIGLLILAHNSPRYVAAKLAPEILTADFPIHIWLLSQNSDGIGELLNQRVESKRCEMRSTSSGLPFVVVPKRRQGRKRGARGNVYQEAAPIESPSCDSRGTEYGTDCHSH